MTTPGINGKVFYINFDKSLTASELYDKLIIPVKVLKVYKVTKLKRFLSLFGFRFRYLKVQQVPTELVNLNLEELCTTIATEGVNPTDKKE